MTTETKYKIIDNFLSENEFVNLRNAILHNVGFPWFSCQGVADINDKSDKFFTHTVYDEWNVKSNFFNFVLPILNKLEVRAIVRIRVNMYLKNSNLISHAKHVDGEFEHKGFMFYLNSNDGYTELEDGTKIASVANRGLHFEPNKLHNSTNCTDELYRANISINYF